MGLSLNGANNSASDTPRVTASRSILTRLRFCSPRLTEPMKVRCKPARSASSSCDPASGRLRSARGDTQSVCGCCPSGRVYYGCLLCIDMQKYKKPLTSISSVTTLPSEVSGRSRPHRNVSVIFHPRRRGKVSLSVGERHRILVRPASSEPLIADVPHRFDDKEPKCQAVYVAPAGETLHGWSFFVRRSLDRR